MGKGLWEGVGGSIGYFGLYLVQPASIGVIVTVIAFVVDRIEGKQANVPLWSWLLIGLLAVLFAAVGAFHRKRMEERGVIAELARKRDDISDQLNKKEIAEGGEGFAREMHRFLHSVVTRHGGE